MTPVKSNDEIRREVAKAKGFRIETVERFTPTRNGLGFITEEFSWRNPDNFPIAPLFWSENISDAWELFEEMGKGANIRHAHGAEIADEWQCSFDVPTWYSADTAPRAICHAWLAWKRLNDHIAEFVTRAI